MLPSCSHLVTLPLPSHTEEAVLQGTYSFEATEEALDEISATIERRKLRKVPLSTGPPFPDFFYPERKGTSALKVTTMHSSPHATGFLSASILQSYVLT